MYGGRCVCCGIDRPIFLALDHVRGDGKADRARGKVLARAIAEHRPDLYQILCHNCNMAKYHEENHTCP